MKRGFFHYDISDVTPYIDWDYLFHAWGLKGGSNGNTAEEVLRDAQVLLKDFEGKYRTHAIFAICEARGKVDDIIAEGTSIPLLRQQHAIDGVSNICLSDFVSPNGDTIGLFATSVDNTLGTEYHNDPYLYLLSQMLADRLAEATASLMHLRIRTDKELWGYAEDESLTIEELLAEKNQGIRPAVGYPSLPDQSIIFTIDNLLNLGEIGITLTPNGAMLPHASVCGMIFAHPQAHYFAVGKISDEQLADYAHRRGEMVENIKKFLTKNMTAAHNG